MQKHSMYSIMASEGDANNVGCISVEHKYIKHIRKEGCIMKAIVKTGPQPGVEVVDMPVPTPGPGEVLIKVGAAAICGTDLHYYHWNKSGQDFGAKYNISWPLVLGHECAGTIVAAGEGVTERTVGQRVALETHISCGKCFNCENGMPHNCTDMKIYGTSCNGCFAEYALAPAKVCFVLPDEMTFEEGALLEPTGVSMRAVEECGVQPGETVVVNGCGPIGMLAAMILKSGNAARVIVTDLDDFRLGMAARMGAIPVNAAREDAVVRVRELCASRGGADVVMECSGAAAAYKSIFQFLRPEGRLVTVAHPGGEIPINISKDINTRGVAWKGIFGRRIWNTWWNVSSLIAAKRINVLDVVTHRFTLDQGQEAMALKPQECGKVLFTFDN